MFLLSTLSNPVSAHYLSWTFSKLHTVLMPSFSVQQWQTPIRLHCKSWVHGFSLYLYTSLLWMFLKNHLCFFFRSQHNQQREAQGESSSNKVAVKNKCVLHGRLDTLLSKGKCVKFPAKLQKGKKRWRQKTSVGKNNKKWKRKIIR